MGLLDDAEKSRTDSANDAAARANDRDRVAREHLDQLVELCLDFAGRARAIGFPADSGHADVRCGAIKLNLPLPPFVKLTRAQLTNAAATKGYYDTRSDRRVKADAQKRHEERYRNWPKVPWWTIWVGSEQKDWGSDFEFQMDVNPSEERVRSDAWAAIQGTLATPHNAGRLHPLDRLAADMADVLSQLKSLR